MQTEDPKCAICGKHFPNMQSFMYHWDEAHPTVIKERVEVIDKGNGWVDIVKA